VYKTQLVTPELDRCHPEVLSITFAMKDGPREKREIWVATNYNQVGIQLLDDVSGTCWLCKGGRRY